MRQGLISLLLVLFCVSAKAQMSNVLDSAPAGFRQFLNDDAGAFEVLSNIVGSRQIRFDFSYVNGPGVSPYAYQYTNSILVILINKDRPPAEQFVGIIFEVNNSENVNEVSRIIERVKSGTTTREIYANQMLQLEFNACKKIRDVLGVFKDDERIAKNPFYRTHSVCPDTYDDFIVYLQKNNGASSDPLEHFGRQFDEMQRQRGERLNGGHV